MDEIIQMIKRLKGDGGIEFNINANSVIPYNQTKGKDNIYFVAGGGIDKNRRNGDDHVTSKRYYVVDIDIRKDWFHKTGIVLDQSELRDKIAEVVNLLDKSEFGDYCAMTDSGNGLHLYYTGTERSFSKEVYSSGVGYIYEQINEIIKETGLKCDGACKNIARIMRFPGTINQRKKIEKDKVLRDLGPIECELLYVHEKNSMSFEKIEEYAELYKQEVEKDKQEQVKIKEIIKKDYKKGDDIWKQINEIPACDIACDIRGVRLTDRGLDNMALREATKNMGAYWYKPHNVIVNTGSSLIKTDKSYFTSYELVYYELMDQDKKATVEYFKDKYGIGVLNKNIIVPKIDHKTQGYLYPNKTFDDFDCVMSGELVTIVARSNSGKTTFAMDIIQTNSKRGKKCFYINLEFAIETMWRSRWLYLNKKKKRNLTDIDPLTKEEQANMDKYVAEKLKQFDYYNSPNGMELQAIVDMIISKQKEGYGLFVIDTFSRITGNLDSAIAHTNQNKSMETLHELCQNLGVVVLLLHHTNKKGEFEGSQKIMDLSNVFITMMSEEDGLGEKITTFELSKDKFVTSIKLETYYRDQQYSLVSPKKIVEVEVPF